MLNIILKLHILNAVIAIIGCIYSLIKGDALWAINFFSNINTSLLCAILVELANKPNDKGEQ